MVWCLPLEQEALHSLMCLLAVYDCLENLSNFKNCQNIRENSGKLDFLVEKPGKLREMYNIIPNENVFEQIFFSHVAQGKI